MATGMDPAPIMSNPENCGTRNATIVSAQYPQAMATLAGSFGFAAGGRLPNRASQSFSIRPSISSQKLCDLASWREIVLVFFTQRRRVRGENKSKTLRSLCLCVKFLLLREFRNRWTRAHQVAISVWIVDSAYARPEFFGLDERQRISRVMPRVRMRPFVG